MTTLRHPQSGALYEELSDGRVRVTDADGRSGVFEIDGRWLSGELREADPHMLGWVGGPKGRHGRSARRSAKSGGSSVAPATGRGGAIPADRSLEKPLVDDPEDERRSGMDLGLAGRKALVTAASRGIGLSIVKHLADEGADVALCARSQGGLESAAKDLESRGVRVFTQAVDVGDGDALRAFVEAAGEALGGLDIVVCNASGGSGQGEAAWQANFDIDLMGAVRAVEAATPMLSESDAGSVVLISSTAALEYLGVPQSYNVMKAAMLAHAGDLSQSLAPRGIRVNTVSPGPIYFEGGNWEMIKNAMPAIYENALEQCAIGRMGTPEEVARAVVFLASPAASLITGANLVCDGGFTKRVAY